ncbi:MAG: DUF4260 family protein [Rhodobacteraceae bacterium]|nr:DUF4260 family protein [Paracoccaceae bacterium]
MTWAVAWQRAEGAGVLIGSLALAWALGAGWSWWAALLIFFAPDMTFAGYLVGPRIGAAIYNLAHLYASGALLLGAGLLFGLPALAFVGALWLGHAGFDRALGYGLKLPGSFKETHLGNL